MRKIITEILVLLWKAFKLVLWKWLRPILGKVVIYSVLIAGVVAMIIYFLAQM
ncbi:MAG: hypothetical protein U0359_06340 [Byssovorax sp.]